MTGLAVSAYLACLAPVGRTVDAVACHAGQMALLAWRVAVATARGKVRWCDVRTQLDAIGAASIPLVCVTAVLSGIVTSQQGGYQFTGSVPLYVLGSVVTSSVVLELGPVMTAFVLIGRVGRPHHRRARDDEGLRADRRPLLPGPRPGPVLAAPRIIAGHHRHAAPGRRRQLVGVLRRHGLRPAHAWASGPRRSSTAPASSGTTGTSSIRSSRRLVFGFIIPVISVHMGLMHARRRGGRRPHHHAPRWSS